MLDEEALDADALDADAFPTAEDVADAHGLTPAESPRPTAVMLTATDALGPRVVPGWPADPIYARVDSLDALPGWARDLLWRRHEEPERRGGGVSWTPAPTISNVTAILARDPRWARALARNDFAERDEIRTVAPWHAVDAAGSALGAWTDVDTTRLRSWLSRAYGLQVTISDAEAAVAVASAGARFHPVCTYLSGLRWDGIERLPDVLAEYFGALSTPYTRAVGRRWTISAVARVRDPGCQVDCTLVLEGAQGIGKSRALRTLVPDPSLYGETGITIGDKDSYQCLHGVWIYVLDELDALRRGVELTRTKNFLTSIKDHYRPSYGRRSRDFLRQTIFAGTTNEDAWLWDTTGNRRFWPVRVLQPIDAGKIARDRDQIWAEAAVRHKAGEPWHVDTVELRALCEAEQADRVQTDPWAPLVATWLATPTELSVDDRGHPTRNRIDTPDEGWLTSDVLINAVGKRRSDLTKGDEMRIASVLRAIGYERGPQLSENGARVRRYRRA